MKTMHIHLTKTAMWKLKWIKQNDVKTSEKIIYR